MLRVEVHDASNTAWLRVGGRFTYQSTKKGEPGARGRVVRMHARKVADSGSGELARRQHTSGQEAKRFLSSS